MYSYAASDYAGIKGEGVRLYYGYEETVPEELTEYQEESGDYEWAFVAEIPALGIDMRIPQSDLDANGDWSGDYLLAGIAEVFDKLTKGKQNVIEE